MTSTGSYTDSYSWTETDVANVVSRFNADLLMIAQSSSTHSERRVREIAHDVEYLARRGYLARIAVMLFDGDKEVRAAEYTVNEEAGGISSSRPGNVLWPRLPNGELNVVLTYSKRYDSAARAMAFKSLKRPWSRSSLSTDHAGLGSTGGRDYAQNGWGLQRRDYQC